MINAFRSLPMATAVALLAVLGACSQPSSDQPAQASTTTPTASDQGEDLWAALNEAAIVEQMVMVPMRDGVRLATHIYRPRTSDGEPVPTIFVKTPYNMNLWGATDTRT
jgi:predicted acyl esterase